MRAFLASATTHDARGVRRSRVRARSTRARGACALERTHARVDCVTIGRSFELRDAVAKVDYRINGRVNRTPCARKG